jgi:hypothetical protein
MSHLMLGEARLLAGGDCRVCGDPIQGEAVFCLDCHTPHHEECAVWVGSCSMFGCGGQQFTRQLPGGDGASRRPDLDFAQGERAGTPANDAAGAEGDTGASVALSAGADPGGRRPRSLVLQVWGPSEALAASLMTAGVCVTVIGVLVLAPSGYIADSRKLLNVSQGFALTAIGLFLAAALIPRYEAYVLDGRSGRLTHQYSVLGLELAWAVAPLSAVRAAGIDRRPEGGGAGVREWVYLELAGGRRIRVSPETRATSPAVAATSPGGQALRRLRRDVSRMFGLAPDPA